jgi:hypothetical protein
LSRAWPQWLGSLHRALGLGSSVLLLGWFTSGMVMLFVTYPGHAPPEPSALDPGAVRSARLPAALLDHAAPLPELTLRSIVSPGVSLGVSLGTGPGNLRRRVVWQFLDGNDQRRTIEVSGPPPAPPAGERLDVPDQWTLNGSLAADFPLLRRDLPGGVIEYRSQASGERVLTLTRWQRGWLIAGPIIHWIYPAILRRHRGPWRSLVLVLATVGMLLSLSGLVFGLWLQRRAQRSWPSSPYRKPAPRLHHQLGLVFGFLAFTWTLSGALSFNPFRWSTGDEPADGEVLRYSGGPLEIRRFTRTPAAALSACARQQAATASLALTQLGGHPWYRCDGLDGSAQWTPGDREEPAQARLPEGAIRAALRQMRAPVQTLVERSEPDSYYYSTHRSNIETPYWRAELKDGSRVYIGIHSGELLRRYERSGLCERWLYHGLHSFDFGPLLAHLWFWRGLLLALLGGGALLAATGIWWSLRRVGRTTERE